MKIILLGFVLSGAVWAQTTYSSPVRVTNTTLPVTGEVRVTGNTPVVTPSGVPLQVKAFDTIPVSQQGTVTVAPAGGQMTVTPNGGSMIVTPQGGSLNVAPSGGTMPVSVTGTPTVGLSPSANTVKMASPAPFFLSRTIMPAIQSDQQRGEAVIGTLPAGELIEIESVHGYCGLPGVNTELPHHYLRVVPFGATDERIHVLDGKYQGHADLENNDIHTLTNMGKIYAKPGSEISLFVERRTVHSRAADCRVVIYGRVY